MIISVINHTNGLLSDAIVQRAIRAINRQIAEDFEPHWGMAATLRLEGNVAGPAMAPPSVQQALDMRGEAIIYLWHPRNVQGALGYHATNFLGIPYGFVFPEVSTNLGEHWTVTLSHEALEIIADPDVNLLVIGPHPANPRINVFHWYEVCDSVQAETYEIDGVPVSNFVLQPYFTNSDELGSRNDFLGLARSGRKLRSFSVNPGSYVGFFNPASGQPEVFFAEGDTIALDRLKKKQELGLTRRSRRYQTRMRQSQPITSAIRQFLGR